MISSRKTMWCGAVVASLAIGGAMAADGQAALEDAVPVTFQGVQVHIDPATGRLRAPDAQQRQALAKVIQQDRKTALAQRPRDEIAARATLRTSRTGQVGAMIQVPDSLLSNVVAERQDDGSLRIAHAPAPTATDGAADREVAP